MPPRLYCIDASIYIFAAYFSYPDRWFSPQGYSLNAVHGYLRFLLRFIRRAQPGHLMVAFDESLGSGFRHRLYANYKSNRVLPDEALAFQLNACRQLSEVMGIRCYGDAEYEADDFIASAAAVARRQDMMVTVVSRDKDLAQVMKHADDAWWDFQGDRLLNKAAWEQQAGIRTEQLADFLALSGDSIDAIPGVPGIGRVTAMRLLQRFGSLEQLYADLDAVAASGLRGAATLVARLADHEGQARLSRQLASLREDIPAVRDLPAMRWRVPDIAAVMDCLLGLGFERRWSQRLLADLQVEDSGP